MKIHHINGPYTYTSQDIVNLISCFMCPSAKTKWSLRQRLNDHKSGTKSKNTKKPVNDRFNLPGESVTALES